MIVTQRDFDRKESDLERQFERDDALRDLMLESYRRGVKDGLELAKWEVCD